MENRNTKNQLYKISKQTVISGSIKLRSVIQPVVEHAIPIKYIIRHNAKGGYSIKRNGIFKGEEYTNTAIVYPTNELNIDRRYPIIVADFPLLMNICTKLVIPIWAIAHPINKVHIKNLLVLVKNESYKNT